MFLKGVQQCNSKRPLVAINAGQGLSCIRMLLVPFFLRFEQINNLPFIRTERYHRRTSTCAPIVGGKKTNPNRIEFYDTLHSETDKDTL